MPLVQLKNGDWIDPKTITNIHVFDEHEQPGGGFRGPRMIILHGQDESVTVIEYPALAAACVARDQLAARANAIPDRPLASSPPLIPPLI